MQRTWKRNLFIATFTVPTFILFALITLYPLIKGLYLSLFKWSGFAANMQFIGLKNYTVLMHDPIFPKTVEHDFYLVFWKVVFIMLISTFFAVALTRLKLRESGFWKVIFFLPNILSVVIIGILWMFIYNPDFGILNGLLKMIGLGKYAHAWLGDPHLALAALVPPSVWAGIGFFMILIMAAILNIPTEVYEAARIDGAGEIRQFFSITLPLIWEQIKTSILFIVITTLNGSYVIVQLLTQGGPNNSTNVMGEYLYQQAFQQNHFGYGAAIGVMILVISIITTLILNRVLKQETIQY